MTDGTTSRKARDGQKLQALTAESREAQNRALARHLIRPSVAAAVTIKRFIHVGRELPLDELIDELADQVQTCASGNMARGEAMLIAQAHSLDAVFNDLARRAASNMGEYLATAETYMRLALKAQTQCRATLETLAAIKNPPVLFARQANIANGPQQVNNGVPSEPPRAREARSQPRELLEAQDGERLDISTSGATSRVDKQLEAVGAVNGAEDERGQG